MPSNFRMTVKSTFTDPAYLAARERFWRVTAVPTPKRETDRDPELMRRRIEAHRALMDGIARLKEREAA